MATSIDGHTETVKMLLEKGAKVELHNNVQLCSWLQLCNYTVQYSSAEKKMGFAGNVRAGRNQPADVLRSGRGDPGKYPLIS